MKLQIHRRNTVSYTHLELFETMLSYFSNTISYVRIGAFAVSHAAMMEVVLMLSGASAGSTNWIIFVIGNIIVCGLEGLVVGIQVLRDVYKRQAVSCPGAIVRWHGEGEPVEIKKSKLRGVASYGMICASDEIGLGDLFPASQEAEILDLSAFDVPAGTTLADALDLNDVLLEIDNKSMTNRPDLWGHYGIAREIAALYLSLIHI